MTYWDLLEYIKPLKVELGPFEKITYFLPDPLATDGDALVVGANDGKETPTGDGPVGDSSIPHMQQSTGQNIISDLLCVEGPEYQPTNDEEHRHG